MIVTREESEMAEIEQISRMIQQIANVARGDAEVGAAGGAAPGE